MYVFTSSQVHENSHLHHSFFSWQLRNAIKTNKDEKTFFCAPKFMNISHLNHSTNTNIKIKKNLNEYQKLLMTLDGDLRLKKSNKNLIHMWLSIDFYFFFPFFHFLLRYQILNVQFRFNWKRKVEEEGKKKTTRVGKT